MLSPLLVAPGIWPVAAFSANTSDDSSLAWVSVIPCFSALISAICWSALAEMS